MVAANNMGFAFYKKVPGYGRGQLHYTTPYTFYGSNDWAQDGISRITGQPVPLPHPLNEKEGLTWDDWEKNPWFSYY